MQEHLDLSGKYILCMAEGAAEQEAMEILLESNRLRFTSDDLIDKKILPRMSVSKLEEGYLSLQYSKPVVILRIIDSRKEKLRLSRQYQNRFEVITINTHPEIEMLLILKNGDYDDYCKTKSKEKPSEYCKRRYGYRKNVSVFRDSFTQEELIMAISKFDSMLGHNELSLKDLLI